MNGFNSIWHRLRSSWRRGHLTSSAATPAVATSDGAHARVADSLRALLDDPNIPPALRSELAGEFARVERMLRKLESGELHVAVFGRVSAGKSALGNALLGREAFEVGVLHGTTSQAAHAELDDSSLSPLPPGEGALQGRERVRPERDVDNSAEPSPQPLSRRERGFNASGLVLIDTPGINELDGEARERLAFDVAEVSDLVVFVCDGDLTRDELDALETLARTQRPLLLALNKADRYGEDELSDLLAHLRRRVAGRVRAEDVVAVSAHPTPRRRVTVDAQGREHEHSETPSPDVAALRERLLAIAAHEGKTLAAVNAGLFAGRLGDQLGARVAETRRVVATRVIRQYCIAKGVMVALNPIPVADLLAAAGLDAAMVVQLSRVYGLPLTRNESGRLVVTICAQLAALMGAVWGMHLVASALKGLSGGLSVLFTAAAQGALAWYATVLIGRAAERYLVNGKSWGEQGAKRAVADIVASLDRDSILREAREEILKRLKRDRPSAP